MARGKGRPAKARAGDVKSIKESIQWSVDKFDARLANDLDDLLAAYYSLATEAESETTRRTVLKELIDRAQSKIDERRGEEGEEQEVVETAPLISLTAINSD